MPWWLAVLTVALVGWLLNFASEELHHAALSDELLTYGLHAEHAPPELLDEFSHDAGRGIESLLGWLYALMLFVPYLVVYGLLQLSRRWYVNRHASCTDGPSHLQ
jgi:hypothetical protein